MIGSHQKGTSNTNSSRRERTSFYAYDSSVNHKKNECAMSDPDSIIPVSRVEYFNRSTAPKYYFVPFFFFPFSIPFFFKLVCRYQLLLHSRMHAMAYLCVLILFFRSGGLFFCLKFFLREIFCVKRELLFSSPIDC